MSRIIILGDLHFGTRRNSKTFHDILLKELTWSFSQIKKTDSVVILGDIFDSRSSVDFKILNDAWDYFIKLSRSCKELFILAGNHDEYYKEFSRENTNCRFLEFEPGSDSKIAPVKVVTDLSVIKIAGYSCLFIPWIDTEAKKNAAKGLLDGAIDVIFGHFDSEGLYSKKEDNNPLSFTRDDFTNIPLVLSGHYHKRIQNGNIQYVGSFINSTFNDLDEIKGLHIIESDHKITFKQNTCPTFHYLTIDNPALFLKAMETANSRQLEDLNKKINGNFIKIFLQEYRKENDEVFNIIKSFHPLDVFIAFNRSNFTDDTPIDFEGFDSKTDIAAFLTEYVDGIKDKIPSGVDVELIKSLISKKSLEYKQTITF